MAIEFGFSPLGMSKEEVVRATGAAYPDAPGGRIYSGYVPIAGPIGAAPSIIGGFAQLSNIAKVGAVAGVVAGVAGLVDLGMPERGLIQLPGGTSPGGAFPQAPGVGSIPLGGPGLAEPPAQWVVKEWHRRIDSRDGDFTLQYYLVKPPGRAYRILMYNTRTRAWKSWGMPRPAVIGKNMPSHKMLTRLRRNLSKHGADAKTILKITNPTAYAKQLGYKKYRHHRR